MSYLKYLLYRRIYYRSKIVDNKFRRFRRKPYLENFVVKKRHLKKLNILIRNRMMEKNPCVSFRIDTEKLQRIYECSREYLEYDRAMIQCLDDKSLEEEEEDSVVY